MMNVLETEWWTLALPPEWWAEAEGESIFVGDRDDVGCVEISTLCKESGQFTSEEVYEVATEGAEHALDWHPVSLGEFTGIHCSYVDEGTAIREWCVARGPVLLFLTYSCDEENRAMDDAAVDEILDTLLPV